MGVRYDTPMTPTWAITPASPYEPVARRSFDLARSFSSMVAKLDPSDWRPTALRPVEGLFDFEGPGGMVLVISVDGRFSHQVPAA